MLVGVVTKRTGSAGSKLEIVLIPPESQNADIESMRAFLQHRKHEGGKPERFVPDWMLGDDVTWEIASVSSEGSSSNDCHVKLKPFDRLLLRASLPCFDTDLYPFDSVCLAKYKSSPFDLLKKYNSALSYENYP